MPLLIVIAIIAALCSPHTEINKRELSRLPSYASYSTGSRVELKTLYSLARKSRCAVDALRELRARSSQETRRCETPYGLLRLTTSRIYFHPLAPYPKRKRRVVSIRPSRRR